jgi:hypothetical protein
MAALDELVIAGARDGRSRRPVRHTPLAGRWTGRCPGVPRRRVSIRLMNQLVRTRPSALPELVATVDDRAGMRFLEFFAVNIRKPHTRRAYPRVANARSTR